MLILFYVGMTDKRLTRSILPINRIIIIITTPGQSRTRNNGNYRVLHIPQSFWTRASKSDSLMPYPRHSIGVFTLGSDEFGVFYCPSRLGNTVFGYNFQPTAVSIFYSDIIIPKYDETSSKISL